MPQSKSYLPKFKDTITDMNRYYSLCLRASLVGQTRVEYLKTFEKALELNLESSIVKNPRYFRISAKYPLPERGYVPAQIFDLYIMLYSFVMRDANLLNREAEMQYNDFGADAFGGDDL